MTSTPADGDDELIPFPTALAEFGVQGGYDAETQKLIKELWREAALEFADRAAQDNLRGHGIKGQHPNAIGRRADVLVMSREEARNFFAAGGKWMTRARERLQARVARANAAALNQEEALNAQNIAQAAALQAQQQAELAALQARQQAAIAAQRQMQQNDAARRAQAAHDEEQRRLDAVRRLGGAGEE